MQSGLALGFSSIAASPIRLCHFGKPIDELDPQGNQLRQTKEAGGPPFLESLGRAWKRLLAAIRLKSAMNARLLVATACLIRIAVAQTSDSTVKSISAPASNHTSAKHDVGSGAGDIGKGTAKGVGSAAKGTGKAAGDLVTLHPINAATDLGKGAADTGKNVGVGTAKGTAKILKGTGKAIKHLF